MRTIYPILQQALATSPASQEVIFELLFALNATQRYQKVWQLMEDLPKENNALQSGMVWRELAFTSQKTGDLENAALFHARAFELLPVGDAKNKAEIALNCGSAQFQRGEQEQGSKWWNLAWQLAEEGSDVHNHLKRFIKNG